MAIGLKHQKRARAHKCVSLPYCPCPILKIELFLTKISVNAVRTGGHIGPHLIRPRDSWQTIAAVQVMVPVQILPAGELLKRGEMVGEIIEPDLNSVDLPQNNVSSDFTRRIRKVHG